MALVIVLVGLAVFGIVYGVVNKLNAVRNISILGLIVIGILLLVYQYLYSQNPY